MTDRALQSYDTFSTNLTVLDGSLAESQEIAVTFSREEAAELFHRVLTSAEHDSESLLSAIRKLAAALHAKE